MTNKFVISAFCSLVMSACDKSPSYDLTLLQTYSLTLDETFHVKEKLDPPYVALFKSQDCALLYFASRHAADIKSPTFHGIRRVMEQFSPDLVLLEGMQINDGISPKKFREHIQKVCLADWKCSEIYYAAHLAPLENIPFLGVEPTDSEIFKILQAEGYTQKDVIFFYFARQIPQYYREKQIHTFADLPALFPIFLSRYLKNSEYKFQDYTAWLQEKLNRDIPWADEIDSNFTAPIDGGHYLQKLSSRVGLLRDQHIVMVVLESLAEHKKVLLIMGASHYPIQKDVLIKYLGNPSYFSTTELLSFGILKEGLMSKST